MSSDKTQLQDDQEFRRAQQLSLQRTRPPNEVPGYEAERFLGSGAYGEVWAALDRNTGRRVAIKFYAHRGGVDWTLLSREVEKLVILSADRYVVQLLQVGWDAEPPFYVMEYIDGGSLDERIRVRGALPVGEAVSMFRDVAVGLAHAHGKGVLHCDLKPANILLDADVRPRIADFGQSRLSHEQTPALGTLFYMAPEQADMRAVPDARWDVYALGALLYTMLVGQPPHRSDHATTEIETASNLQERLRRYRKYIESRSVPTGHHQVPGVDRPLAEIVERCLEVDPEQRFPAVQAVIEALDRREIRRARLPLKILGLAGPALLMLIVGLFAWLALNAVLETTAEALTKRALEGDQFAAQYVAKAAANDLDRHFLAVEQVASNPELLDRLRTVLADPSLTAVRELLNDPAGNPSLVDEKVDDQVKRLRQRLRQHPASLAMQRQLAEFFDKSNKSESEQVASWFVNDALGLQLSRYPPSETIGRNWAWRTYFHGGREDHRSQWRPGPGERLQHTHLSAVFQSKATGQWIAAVSTPILDPAGGAFLGVVSLTVKVGRIVNLPGREDLVPVLVDSRKGKNQGLILQHPLYDKILKRGERLDEQLSRNRVPLAHLAATLGIATGAYRDPLANDPRGREFAGPWLVGTARVRRGGRPSGLVVLVQERRDQAIGQTLQALRASLMTIGGIALAMVAAVWTGLWALVGRVLTRASRKRPAPGRDPESPPAETVFMGKVESPESRVESPEPEIGERGASAP